MSVDSLITPQKGLDCIPFEQQPCWSTNKSQFVGLENGSTAAFSESIFRCWIEMLTVNAHSADAKTEQGEASISGGLL